MVATLSILYLYLPYNFNLMHAVIETPVNMQKTYIHWLGQSHIKEPTLMLNFRDLMRYGTLNIPRALTT